MKRKINWVLLALVVLLMITSCATTHKTTTETSSRAYDSTAVVRTDTSNVHSERRDSVSLVRKDSASVITSATETAEDEETVTEHITETVDSAGNKTTTTDRTIHRKGTTAKESTSANNQWHEQEQTALYLSMLDSIVNSRQSDIGTHWSAKDSTYQAQTKDTTSTISWWQKLGFYLGWIIGIVVFVAFAIFVWKTKD